ncbi:alpha/beta hydrolase [Rhizobacter sp. J219]|jgi:arylformamidase|uniref:alpha/beta hydrolase n=1 Tax=Rhizobacter sp. J219 TaxID=2898430 RepID=UPI00215148E1|nr:alpha/beta hydrolase [Rhizobacter sp. J219]MCR5886047.1 alpha/beta hydrolase [Rhizobacter sp. J219]
MTTFDPGWLDVQYNNRARVPGHQQIFERWRLASARVREGMTCVADVPYGIGPDETLDIFPAAEPRSPVFVFIHGGWWRSLDKADHSFLAASFVSAGAMVVMPNYSLCPGTDEAPVGIDTIALQMTRALAWVYRNAALYGGSPGRIVVAGHSAGAHLAAMMLCCEWPEVDKRLPIRMVREGLGISGVYDLKPIQQTPFLQADLRLTPEAVDRLSPARFRAPREACFYAAVGADESEEFLRQSQLLQLAWGKAAVPRYEAVAGANHFTVLHDLADPEGVSHRLALDLLGLPRVNPET